MAIYNRALTSDFNIINIAHNTEWTHCR